VPNTSLNGIYIHDVKLGQNIFINSRYTALTGYTFDDLNKMDKVQFFELFHPDDRQRMAEHMEKLVAGSNDMLEIEYRFKTKDGRWIRCLSHDCVFARDEDDSICQVIGTFFDITECRQLEEDARQISEAAIREHDLLEALVKSISDEIWFANTEGKFTLVNPSGIQQFVLDDTADGIDVKKLAESLEIFRTDGSPRPIEETPALLALQGEVVRNQEEIVRTPAAGELRHRQVSSTPVRDTTGSIIGSVSVVRDITGLKQAEEALQKSEERLNLAINNAGMGTWDVDLSTCNAIWSENHFRLLGYEPQDRGKATMEMWRSRIHPDDLERVLSAVDRAKREKSLYALEHRIIRADTGEVVWLWPFGRFLYDEGGEPFRFLGVFFDSTERKEAEEKLRQAEATSEALNRELEQRVRARTAEIEAQYKELEELNEIIRQLSRKTIEAMESDRKALSKEIHDSIAGSLAAIKLQLETRMSRMDLSARDLPSDLMPFEKIVAHLKETIKETRRISWQLRSRTLDDLGLKSALIEHIGHFKQFYPGIKVVSQIEIEDKGISDDIQTVLYRVAQEALNNAGRHSSATRVRIKLTNLQNQICLEIEDNGCGFELEKTVSDAVSLTGYGLHSMRERVEICKGNFEIHSEPGKGTVIKVSIPI
jgi:PAS domain S-box-containing protein